MKQRETIGSFGRGGLHRMLAVYICVSTGHIFLQRTLQMIAEIRLWCGRRYITVKCGEGENGGRDIEGGGEGGKGVWRRRRIMKRSRKRNREGRGQDDSFRANLTVWVTKS